jgi:phosphatidylglycerophosphatase A
LMTPLQSDKVSVVDIFRRAGWSGKAALIMATWFGSGLAPRASGTFGTLAAIPLILIYRLGPAGSVAALAGIILVAVWSAHRTGELLGTKDPSEVVIDEAAGFFVTLFLLPITWESIFL